MRMTASELSIEDGTPVRATTSAGDLEGRPVNSLLYELTKPVDRDVFRRENRYFDALEATRAGTGPAPAGAPAPGSPEK